MLRKLFWIRLLIWSLFDIHSPRAFLMHLILFLFLLTIVDTWNNEVLWSPKVAQFRRYLSAQCPSSWSIIREYSSVSYYSSWTKKLLGWFVEAFWALFNYARTLFFLAERLPNTSLFHWLALLMKFGKAELRGEPWSLAFWATRGNSGRSSHIV